MNKNAFHTLLLQMLGRYPYTLIIGHKSCNMLSMLNKLNIEKRIANFGDK